MGHLIGPPATLNHHDPTPAIPHILSYLPEYYTGTGTGMVYGIERMELLNFLMVLEYIWVVSLSLHVSATQRNRDFQAPPVVLQARDTQ